MKCLVTFKTTSAALMFERACREAGIAARVTPVPRAISSSCGLACEFPCEDRSKVEVLVKERRIEVAGIYEI